jgi:hypothetical protein
MPRRSLAVTAVAVGAVLLVVGVDSATYAATGSSLILGRTNAADAVTSLRASKGPALDLRPGASTDAPLTVSGTGKVWNLNVDRLDSLDSRDLQRRINQACGPGRALTGVGSSGDPSCSPIEPATLVLRVSDPGRLDAPFGATTADIPSGRYRVELTAALEPTVAGTPAAPKQGRCAVLDDGRILAAASGRDTGSGQVPLQATGLVSVAGGAGLDVVCGFPRGTWGFADAAAPVLVLTPVPNATAVPVVASGERDWSTLD